MIDVKELNQKVQELGLDKLGFIIESDDGEHYGAYVDPECCGSEFGFDVETCTFREDTGSYWDSYRIEKNELLDKLYDIVLIGYGTAYAE